MPGGADLEALRAALGADAIVEHEPVEVDGLELGASVLPGDAEALAEALRRIGGQRLGVLVRGGGTRLGLGNRPRDAALLLSTERLRGVDVLDAEEGVAHARCGTPLGELAAATAGTGWELPFDPPGPHTTLGGTLAAAAIGPRHLGFGRPRDRVLGLEVVLGDGVRTKCGGRVVKNVTGYDLMKLHVGALGTLGVIEGAWIRLRPAPERVEVLLAAAGRTAAALGRGIEAARLPSARAVALVGPDLAEEVAPSTRGTSGYLLVVELAGDAAPVEWDRRALAERVSAEPAPSPVLERVRSLQGRMPADGGLRFRLTARPSCLSPVLEALERGGASLLAYPGTGVLYAGFGLRDPASVPEATWRCVAAAAGEGSGGFLLEAAPHAAKEGRDVFGGGAANLGLLRALKQRFDPGAVLNPGRYVGGL